jgi:hypothetical protein
VTIRSLLAVTALLVAVTAACTTGDTGSAPGESVDGPTAAQRIYEKVAPSIAYIETEYSSGSGILVDDTTLLTAAHVVWPLRSVRVVFPDGTEIPDAPVLGRDLFGDLAVVDLSGSGTLPPPATVGDGESLVPGRPMYMVGYPGETEPFPQATISEGILSRFRQWDPEDWTFIQSDASVAGGQSGGALVDEDGRVVGITNFTFTDGFGLSGSLGDAAPRIERMRQGEDLGGIGDRLPPDGPGSPTFEGDIANVWQDHIFVFEAPLYSTFEANASSEADLSLALYTIDGIEIVTADDSPGGFETIDERLDYRGMYFLRVESVDGSGTVDLESSIDLTEWMDPDDGRLLERGTTVTGNADYPGDFDWYRIDLAAGETVTIEVDAIAFDPSLLIDDPSADGDSDAYDDDSGGGAFGTNPLITFTADAAGRYYAIVADDGETGPGAYRIMID